MTRWPDEGHHTVYDRKRHCPCIFYCAYCSDMHTRQGYSVVWLDSEWEGGGGGPGEHAERRVVSNSLPARLPDMQSYHALLKGEPEITDD